MNPETWVQWYPPQNPPEPNGAPLRDKWIKARLSQSPQVPVDGVLEDQNVRGGWLSRYWVRVR